MWTFAAAVQDGRLSFREIVADIPHDIPAMVVYGMMALFLGFMWWGSRSKGGGKGSDRTPDTTTAVPPSSGKRHDD